MKKSRLTETSITSLAMLLALTALPKPAAALLAQTSAPSLPAPTEVPSGTAVDIDGSTSMAAINQSLKQRFETQFPGTSVAVNYGGTSAALQALRDGQIDLAAIGRPLTEAEGEGLVVDPLTRRKIAIIVGSDNPFTGSLTVEQFAKIFRGEITNWSEVGGPTGAIRVIDRPETSDTRQAFQAYPAFQNAPLETGANASELPEDSTEAVIKALGSDGIGYAIVDQVVDLPGVRIVPMHDTLPTDSRYPFSQPLAYVYKGPEPNAEVKAFLGYAATPKNQTAVDTARLTEAAEPSPEAAPPTAIVSPSAAPVAPAASGTAPTEAPAPAPNVATYENVPWWPWWLAIPLLGGLLWWLLKDRGAAAVADAVSQSQIVLTPRNCKEGYAYWEVPEAAKEDLRRQGGKNLALRLYDVTDIDDTRQAPHSVQQFDCDEQLQDQHLPIPVDNRDYSVELGYVTDDDRWLKLARSLPVHVPACPAAKPERIVDGAVEQSKPTSRIGDIVKQGAAVTAGAVGAAVVNGAGQRTVKESRIVLTPRNSRDLYAYWEIPEEHKAALRRQGGQKLALRIYDATGIDLEKQSAPIVREYECGEQATDLHIPTPESALSDRTEPHDYVAELGYLTEEGRWLKLARSTPLRLSVASSANGSATSIQTSPVTTSRLSQSYGDAPNSAASAPSYSDRSDQAVADRPVGASASGLLGTAKNTQNLAGDVAAARSFLRPGRTGLRDSSTAPVDDQIDVGQDSRIILVPRSSQAAYAYWEISQASRDAVKRQGGKMLLRIYEVTNMDMDYVPAHSMQQFECDESEQDRHVPIPLSDRDYVAEIGYTTAEGRWLSIIRSLHTRIPV